MMILVALHSDYDGFYLELFEDRQIVRWDEDSDASGEVCREMRPSRSRPGTI
jgi:hypothetical protein